MKDLIFQALNELQKLCQQFNAEIMITSGKVMAQVSDGHGIWVRPIEELIDAGSDSAQYFASLHNVSKEHYLKFIEFRKNGLVCADVTRDGDPCKGTRFSRKYMDIHRLKPSDWSPSMKTYCVVHDQARINSL